MNTNITYYLYRLVKSLKFDKCGATNNWDDRCRDNLASHGPQSIITLLETMEGPNTEEFWQVVGDREWELADQYGYRRGEHYRTARLKILHRASLGGRKTADKQHLTGQFAALKTPEHQSKAAHAANSKKRTCPKCGTVGSGVTFYMHHRDNCKLDPILIAEVKSMYKPKTYGLVKQICRKFNITKSHMYYLLEN